MAAKRTSSRVPQGQLAAAILRGLDRPGERLALAGCVLLAAAYLCVIGWLHGHADRVDLQFYRNREAFLVERTAHFPLPLNTPVPIGSNGAAARQFALVAGWSVVEPGGLVWSDGPVATIGLTLPADRPRDAVLQLSATLSLDASGRQRVQAELNGRPAAAWDLRVPRTELRLPVPPGAVPPSGATIVTLQIGSPHSPSPKDARQLGIALHAITLAAGSEE